MLHRIKMPLWSTAWLVFALAPLLAAPLAVEGAPREVEGEAPLLRAQQLASLSLLKQASQVLLAELNDQDQLSNRQRAQLSLELADIYRQSDLPAESLAWARRSIAAIDAAAEDNPNWLADARVRAGVLAAQALESQGNTPAADRQLRSLVALDRQLPPDPLRQLRVQMLQAELAAGRASANTAALQRQLLETLSLVRTRAHDSESNESGQWRIKASRVVADAYVSLGKRQAAAQEFEWLLAQQDTSAGRGDRGEASGADPRAIDQRAIDQRMINARVELLGRLAAERRSAGNTKGQIAALSAALALATERLPAGAIETLPQVDALLTCADLKHRLATASSKQNPDQAAKWFAAAYHDARRVPDVLPTLKGIGEDERTSRELLANKRQLEAVQAAARAGAALADVEKTGLLGELRQSLSRAVLPEDSRLALVNSALAAEYVVAGQFARAEQLLAGVLDRFGKQRGRQIDLASALVLMAEIRQAQGRLPEARQLLDQASQAISRQKIAAPRDALRGPSTPAETDRDLLGDIGPIAGAAGDSARRAQALAVWIAIHRGRIDAAEGRYTSALDWLDQAQHQSQAGDQDTTVALAAALAERGAVYRVLARFDDAQQVCQQAIDLRLAHSAATDPELLPYQLALAGVAAAKRDVPVLRRAVTAARAIVAAQRDPATSQAPTALLHLEAMSHFLADSEALAQGSRPADGSDHRRQAQRLWQDALAQQQRQGLAVDQARSRHYLSQIALRDALDERDSARSGDSGGDSGGAPDGGAADYNLRLAELERRITTHQQASAKLTEQQEAYRVQLTDYRRAAAEKQSDSYANLMAERTKLNDQAKELAEQGALLETERQRLDALYLSGDLSGGNRLARQRLAAAASQARQACDLLAELAVYPRLHYAALCNYAEVLRAQAGTDAALRAAAVARLRDAVALVETPCLNVGDEAAQAEFFARHGAAFDLLVEWSIADGDVRQALAYADWSRNRTFLDQIRSSKRNETTTGSQHANHRNREAKLARYRLLLAQLRRLATSEQPSAPDNQDADPAPRRRLLTQLETIRQELLAGQDATNAAAPAESALLPGALSPEAVDRVIKNLLASGERVLYYYIGRRKSFLFLVGFESGQVEVVRLKTLASDGVAAVPAGREAIDRISHDYQTVCRSSSKSQTLMRGGAVAERLAAAASVVLPDQVRGRLQVLAADWATPVTVVPDGPLFQLPLPALVMAPTTPPKFLIDQSPPLVLAPSLMVREALSRPSSLAAGVAGSKQLLSLARPVYLSPVQLAAAPAGTAAARYRALGGSVEDLMYTQVESDSICGNLQPAARRQLLGPMATESALRTALATDRPRVLHLATHGVASNASGAIQGALALAAPRDTGHTETGHAETARAAADDGFLELAEITELALDDCQLAVLSACQTNTGADRPLEMGTSFARAFLAAGARRVAATRWKMDDQSGATIVNAFFRELGDLDAIAGGNYPLAMLRARQAVRRNPAWDSPYHWAVFTLIGGQ